MLTKTAVESVESVESVELERGSAGAGLTERDRRGRVSPTHPHVYMRYVAVQAGISAGYVSKILRGMSTPSIAVAVRVAEVMGTSLEEFIGSLPPKPVTDKNRKKRKYKRKKQ